MRRVSSVLVALVLAAGCGSATSDDDGSADGPTIGITASTTDSHVSHAAKAFAATLQEAATDVETFRTACEAAVGQNPTAEQVADCDTGYMTGTLDQAATLIAAGQQLTDDLAGASLPPSVSGTPALLDELQLLSGAAAGCPDETQGTCAVTRADVLEKMDRVIALLPAWQVLV